MRNWELGIRFFFQCVDGESARVAAVVAADDGQGAERGHAVAQEGDAGVGEESLDVGRAVEVAGIVLVVAEAGVDGCLYASQLGGHAVVEQGPQRAVDDVAGDEHGVGALGVDEVDPPGQVGAAVVVAQVQVADGQQLERLVEASAAVEVEADGLLVLVVYASVDEDGGHEAEERERGRQAVAQPGGGQQVHQAQQVGQQESHQQVEHDHQRAGPYIIYKGGHGHGHAVEEWRHGDAEHGEAEGLQGDDEPARPGGQRGERPEVPAHVGHQGYDEEYDESEAHGRLADYEFKVVVLHPGLQPLLEALAVGGV